MLKICWTNQCLSSSDETVSAVLKGACYTRASLPPSSLTPPLTHCGQLRCGEHRSVYVLVCLCVTHFSCVIPEAPLTPSLVLPFSDKFFFSFIYLFFLTTKFWTGLFPYSKPQHSTNMMEFLFQSAQMLFFPSFFDTISLNSACQCGILLVWQCK